MAGVGENAGDSPRKVSSSLDSRATPQDGGSPSSCGGRARAGKAGGERAREHLGAKGRRAHRAAATLTSSGSALAVALCPPITRGQLEEGGGKRRRRRRRSGGGDWSPRRSVWQLPAGPWLAPRNSPAAAPWVPSDSEPASRAEPSRGAALPANPTTTQSREQATGGEGGDSSPEGDVAGRCGHQAALCPGLCAAQSGFLRESHRPAFSPGARRPQRAGFHQCQP